MLSRCLSLPSSLPLSVSLSKTNTHAGARADTHTHIPASQVGFDPFDQVGRGGCAVAPAAGAAASILTRLTYCARDLKGSWQSARSRRQHFSPPWHLPLGIAALQRRCRCVCWRRALAATVGTVCLAITCHTLPHMMRKFPLRSLCGVVLCALTVSSGHGTVHCDCSDTSLPQYE